MNLNKKGEFGIGSFVMVAVAVIVGLVLLGDSISDNVAEMTRTRTVANSTIAAANFQSGDVNTLTGKAATNVVVTNRTGGETVAAGNYTIANYVILADGTIGSTLTANPSVQYNNTAVNVSYTYEPLGYITESGGRTVANLVILFTALAIAAIALVPTLRNGLIDIVKGYA